MMRRTAVAVATVALAAGLTACGSSGSGNGGSSSQPAAQSSAAGGSSASASGSQTGGVAAKAVTVTVKNFAFGPGDVTVAKGGTVTWKFEDDTAHNVTASDNTFKSKDIQSGSYKYTFNTAGKYDYICSIHQYMKGTVTVK